VERSDTHQLRFVEMMGFAGLNPSYEFGDLPVGQFVSSPVCKNISVSVHPKSHLELSPSHPTEGRVMIVTDAGRLGRIAPRGADSYFKLEPRHCEERSDEAIHALFAARWIASLRSQ
jgi:hypothetical protein